MAADDFEHFLARLRRQRVPRQLWNIVLVAGVLIVTLVLAWIIATMSQGFNRTGR